MKKISVLMPAYKNEKYIKKAILSILYQKLPANWELELLIGVDGCEETLKEVKKLYNCSDNITLYFSEKNYGAYIIRNSLLEKATGDLIGVCDSDDIQLQNNFYEMIKKYEEGYDYITYPVIFIGEQDELLNRPKLKETIGAVFYSRKVFEKIGGWEPLRCFSDRIFFEKARCAGFKKAILEGPGYLYRKHYGQLTQAIPLNGSYRNELKEKLEKDIEKWKKIPDNIEKTELITCKLEEIEKENIYICMATIPSRTESLKKTIKSILDQLPKNGYIKIVLNEYTFIPDFLIHPKIEIKMSSEIGDRGGTGKFYWADKVKGYYLTIDDDIIYPKTYIRDLIIGIEKYKRKALVGFHGNICYSNDTTKQLRRTSYSYLKELKNDEFSHAIGTGVSGFHTDTFFDFSWDYFPVHNVDDLLIGKYCLERNIPCVVLKHPEEYFKFNSETIKDSVYYNSLHKTGDPKKDTSEYQIKLIDSTNWKLNKIIPEDFEIPIYYNKKENTNNKLLLVKKFCKVYDKVLYLTNNKRISIFL